jgi:FaeA-like protein
MAIAVPHEPSDLREQADDLDRRGNELREEARELFKQAMLLRSAADRREANEPSATLARRALSDDARLLARVGDLLRNGGPATSATVAEHLAITQPRARNALLRLEESGAVKRTGLGKGTIWAIADDDEIEALPQHVSATTLIRDAGQRLGTFGFADLNDALPMLSETTLRRELPKLVRAGVFNEERVGNAKVWAFERPSGGPTHRPKHEPPERKVIELARRQSQIAGTGRGPRASSSIVNELIREVLPLGVEVDRTKHQILFKVGGTIVSSCSKTPGASSLKETRSKLIAAGVPVAR